MKQSADKLANPHVAAMAAYTPGLQPIEPGWVKLNTNELPVPPSPCAVEAIQEELVEGGAKLRLYPNPTSAPLREAVASHHGLKPAQVMIGNGADDVLNLLLRTFCGPDRPCAMTVPSYSLYSVLAKAQNTAMLEYAFERSMNLPLEAFISCPAKLFLLTSPNAPTGVGFSATSIAQAADDFMGILAVDETYAPFAHEDAVALLNAYPNLVIVRSFSKAFALAGMRIGYALASPEIISLLDRVRDSYNVDRLAQVAALAALKDVDYYAGVIADTLKLREVMRTWYESLGWFVYPSATNFQFVEPRTKNGDKGLAVAESLYAFLLQRRILVRAFPGHELTKSFLRISLGSKQEMETLKNAINDWLA